MRLSERTAPFERRLDPDAARPIAVAFSGGPDSYLALLRTVVFGRKTGRPVIALHVDHGLHPNSGAWATQAERLADRLGAGFRKLRWLGEKPARGIPAAARAARHRLLAEAAREHGACVIVTGHTGDDALENAALGQGALSEWSPSPAWPEGRSVFLLRPLLNERRAAIRGDLAGQGLELVDDPANADPAHPRIAARLAIAGGAGSPPIPPERPEAAALARRADFPGEAAIRLPGPAFAAAPIEARRRVLAAALTAAGGKPGVARRDGVEHLLARLVEGGDLRAALAGARLIVSAEALLFMRDAGEQRRGGLAPLDLAAGQTGVFDGRYEVEARDGPAGLVAARGRMAGLDPVARKALQALPAPARPASPILAAGRPPLIRPIFPARFLAACGAIAHESGVWAAADGGTRRRVLC